MEIVDYCIAFVSTIKTYCSDKELINCVCMTNIDVIFFVNEP